MSSNLIYNEYTTIKIVIQLIIIDTGSFQRVFCFGGSLPKIFAACLIKSYFQSNSRLEKKLALWKMDETLLIIKNPRLLKDRNILYQVFFNMLNNHERIATKKTKTTLKQSPIKYILIMLTT